LKIKFGGAGGLLCVDFSAWTGRFLRPLKRDQNRHWLVGNVVTLAHRVTCPRRSRARRGITKYPACSGAPFYQFEKGGVGMPLPSQGSSFG